MGHAVALVEAYLQIKGYFTVAEYPAIESFGKQHYGVVTDLDILAFRFPGAGRLILGRGGGLLAPDPALESVAACAIQTPCTGIIHGAGEGPAGRRQT